MGVSASPGLAVGRAVVLRPLTDVDSPAGDADAEVSRARAALEAAAESVAALAGQVSEEEAEILMTGVMMARDPLLDAVVEAEVRERGRGAVGALLAATESQAATLEAIDDDLISARAEDVRSIGRRAARIASGGSSGLAGPSGEPVVLVAVDLGPADVAEVGADVCAIALAGGAVTAHAAIVARSRGLPMVVAAGAAVLEAEEGSEVVVDGDAGEVELHPSPELVSRARADMTDRARAQERALAERELAAVTSDGRTLRVLGNAASAPEVRAGLAAGAEGVGLLRTELGFLDAGAWPTEEEHHRALLPVLASLRGRTATVRVLDFGGDKTPPFLDGVRARGLRLLLEAPDALAAQLRAILRAGEGCDLRILLPMVNSPVELAAARYALRRAVADVPGSHLPQLGSMIETPRAAGVAFALARGSDFLSIGTNDLTHATLGSDRFSAAEAATHHPRVLGAIERSVRAAHAASIPIEVCGEAASDALTMPLLVGLGVDELSVGAARVGTVRAWVRALDHAEAAAVAARALAASSAAEVEALAAPLAHRLAAEPAAATR